MIINANAIHIPLANQSVHMVVTSPPYWGLRDYGVGGQLGLEPTPEEYVANMVNVFREVWRVLRDDGVLFLNIGDSYASQPTGSRPGPHISRNAERGEGNGRPSKIVGGLKEKDLVGIPWRLAFALQADGWYLRSDIIWSKPNPMPESVTDRPTKAHEYIFLLTKRSRYFWDAEAVREECITGNGASNGIVNGKRFGGLAQVTTPVSGYGKRELFNNPAGRNIRTVWEIATQPYKGAHYATFPTALVERCVKAGTSERGVCPKCGAPWVRVVERQNESNWEFRKEKGAVGGSMHFGNKQQIGSGWSHDLPACNNTTLGWRPSCECDAGEPIPATVFDPFVGSGTTVQVAYDLGRRGVGLDLSLEYLTNQAHARIHNGHAGRLL